MSKILNLSNDVKINKSNLDLGSLKNVQILTKLNLSNNKTTITYTLSGNNASSVIVDYVDSANKNSLCLVAVRNGVIYTINKVIDNATIDISKSNNTTITLNVSGWSTVRLIDFSGNVWS